jgi:hypothetical protein
MALAALGDAMDQMPPDVVLLTTQTHGIPSELRF